MESILKDRYIRGMIAGGLAGFITFLWNLFAYYILHITTLLWVDFASALIFRRKPEDTLEFIFASILTLIFASFLGILFSEVIPNIKSRLLWIKGWIFGVVAYFFIFATTLMFRIPTLTEIPAKTGMAHFLSATIWGILLGVFLNYLDSRLKNFL